MTDQPNRVLTVLAAVDVDHVGKTWNRGPDGSLVASKIFPTLWHMDSLPWTTPSDLWSLLDDCTTAQAVCVVRGSPTGGLDPAPRNRHTLKDVPVWWVSLDIDADHLPTMSPDRVRAQLPAPFRNTACWAQHTASSGIKPGVRQRFFFALDAPLSGDTWRDFWRGNTHGVDPSVFKATQVQYLAPPRFMGVSDPVQGRRAVVLPGLPYLATAPVLARVAAAQRSRRPRRPTVGADTAGLYRYYTACVRGALLDVEHAAAGERQMVLVAKAARLVGVALAAGIDPGPDLEALREVALTQRPRDADEINRALAWALDNVTEPKFPGVEE